MNNENKDFTRATGSRVYDDQNSITTNENEYTIMSDAHLFEKMHILIGKESLKE